MRSSGKGARGTVKNEMLSFRCVLLRLMGAGLRAQVVG